ncbi:tetratricopeptide repeat protein [Candidatus Korobacter versatilis]|nr:tetratricopeptide repeat protein [Candidatus Koribacter versatilis]
MMNRLMTKLMCYAVLAAPCAFATGSGQEATPEKDIPLTTSSDVARRAFQGGLENIENQQSKRAHVDFRSAVRADSNFALAHLFLAYDNGNPAEEKAELQKARTLAANASKPEQMLVEWMAGSREGKMVPAISALNDVTSAYPEDKFLLFLAGRWMVQQQNYEGAQRFLERAVTIDPNYPAALNELAYAYAGNRIFDKAFEALDKYAKLLPGEPNTQDSYGEISLKAGRFEQAVEHYKKALEYDSTFVWSQVGLGDSYMLMGKEQQARAEYAKAAAMAPSDGDRLTWQLQSALTYMFAHQHESADDAFTKVAEEASSLHIGKQEAMAHRLMSAYDPDLPGFLRHTADAESALKTRSDISKSDRDQEMALLLKSRAVRAAEFGRTDMANESLKKLSQMAESIPDNVIQQANEGAQGGVLWVQKKYAEAIPHLEEDQGNPLSAARLLQAYRESGDSYRADSRAIRLNSYYEPTLDDYLARQLLNGKQRKK